jgi:hypothetical protein
MNSEELETLANCHIVLSPPMNFTIIMPFSRPHNAELINKSFAAACDGLRGKASLIAACHDSIHLPLIPGAKLVPLCHDWDFCYWKCTQTLNMCLPVPDALHHYFGFRCDDDGDDPGFFANLEMIAGCYWRHGKPPGVMVVSLRRWYHGPAPRKEEELLAIPENMKMGRCGLESFYVRGDIMEKYRFVGQIEGRSFGGGDGELLTRLFREIPREFVFIPDLFTNWNNLPN